MLKYCAVFSLCAGVGLGADYVTGQAARGVIGQTTFTAQASGASNFLIGGVGSVAYANNTLFVTDANRMGNAPINNRVLVYQNLSKMIPSATTEIGPNTGRCPVCANGVSFVLGQPDFTSTNYSTAANGMRLPTGIATDGRFLVVADTANNRVLIWKEIPTEMDQPADLVLGQPDFVTVQEPVVVNANSFRAPQGVWIQDGKLFVADTQNNRIMVWNTFPTKNNQAADLVLGQPNFTTAPNEDIIESSLTAAPNTMLNPTSVTSDGTHLFVADLGFNRVLIWNEIPTKTQQNADVEIGQVNFTTSFANDNTDLCASVGTDADGNPIYPSTCVNTLSFPRYVLSDGTRLYIADAGNDRVLIFNHIPTVNGAGADVVLGQPDQYNDILVSSTNSEFAPNLAVSASYLTPSPSGLAWDGTNLYVTDSLDYRVLIFTPETPAVSTTGIVNAASQALYAQGSITFSGSIEAGDCLLINIHNNFQLNPTYYVYTVESGDTLQTITSNVANLINGITGVNAGSCVAQLTTGNPTVPDPNVYAVPELDFDLVKLVARAPGSGGDTISIASTVGSTLTETSTIVNNVTTISETTSGTATLTASTSASALSDGGDASVLAPGTILSIMGANLSDNTITTPADAQTANPNDSPLPFELGGVEVYIDGIRVGLFAVSPTQIDAQVPFELIDTNSSSLYVRTQHNDGTVSVTTAIGLQIAEAAPGIYAQPGPEPRQVNATHYSSYATGVISVDGTPTAGDTVTIQIEDRQYSYVVLATDTIGAQAVGGSIAGASISGSTVRDALVALINSNNDEKVTAVASGLFSRIILRAKVPGTAGNGLTIGASVVGITTTNATTGVTSTTSPTETMTAINSSLCCANVGGAPVTDYNPAVPGEMVIVYATGLGLLEPQPALSAIQDFMPYEGPTLNYPQAFVSSIIGGLTANVLFAGLQVGAIGVYQVVLQLSSDLPTNPLTTMNISQNIYNSNLVTIPVFSPNPANGSSQ